MMSDTNFKFISDIRSYEDCFREIAYQLKRIADNTQHE